MQNKRKEKVTKKSNGKWEMELKIEKLMLSVEFSFPLVDGVTILADATHNMALIIKHIMLKFNKILHSGNYGNASVLTAKNRQNRQKANASFPGRKNKSIEKMKKNEEK